MLGSAEKKVRLIICEITFEEFHVSSQSTNVTDGQTDRQADGQFTMA